MWYALNFDISQLSMVALVVLPLDPISLSCSSELMCSIDCSTFACSNSSTSSSSSSGLPSSSFSSSPPSCFLPDLAEALFLTGALLASTTRFEVRSALAEVGNDRGRRGLASPTRSLSIVSGTLADSASDILLLRASIFASRRRAAAPKMDCLRRARLWSEITFNKRLRLHSHNASRG